MSTENNDRYLRRLGLGGVLCLYIVLSMDLTVTVEGEPASVWFAFVNRLLIGYYVLGMFFGWGAVKDIEFFVYSWIWRITGRGEFVRKPLFDGFDSLSLYDDPFARLKLLIKLVIKFMCFPLYFVRFVMFSLVAGIPGMIIFPIQTYYYIKKPKKKKDRLQRFRFELDPKWKRTR